MSIIDIKDAITKHFQSFKYVRVQIAVKLESAEVRSLENECLSFWVRYTYSYVKNIPERPTFSLSEQANLYMLLGLYSAPNQFH